ncbi:MAG: ribulose-phosphate 3-epimerase [Clostridiales bacterium]|nr:ribulose-phosphate 3-epimerase [Clostridiales bacterium]
MNKKVYISVSTDPVKEYSGVLQYACEMQGKADMLHCDIMDGKFVKAKTYDENLVRNINQNSLIMLDVHLMCSEPLSLIDDYLDAGANIITVHYEAFKDKNDIVTAIKKIKKANALAGLSISPNTPIKDIKMYIHAVDLVLVMSVEPGASGQSFIKESLDKIKELDLLRTGNKYSYKIEVDGGLNEYNVQKVLDAGADIIVSGSYVYKAKDRMLAIGKLRGESDVK